MARKGQFKKGGGRVGTGTKRRRSPSRAIVKTRTRTVTRAAAPRRRRRGGGRDKMTFLHLALAGAGLAFVVSQSGPDFIRTNAEKIPGAKTFGAAAMIGVSALAVDRFIKPNKWLKLLGTAGVVLAAVEIGKKGKDFKFLGDVGDEGEYDIREDINLEDVDDDDDDAEG